MRIFLASLMVMFWLGFSMPSYGFVFLGPEKPRLKPVDGRIVSFALTDQAPAFVVKESDSDGYFSGQSNAEIFELLVAEAMRIWNEVPGLSIELAIDPTVIGSINPDDNVFSIGIGDLNTRASGLAFPVVNSTDPTEIRDCDIQVARDIVSIPSFIYVLVHELGHCLGLGHNHSDPSAIMGYWQPIDEIALGLDDVAGVLALYPPSGANSANPSFSCGSLSATSRIAMPKQRQQSLWIVSLGLLITPALVVLLCQCITTWSCRRRRQKSGL